MACSLAKQLGYSSTFQQTFEPLLSHVIAAVPLYHSCHTLLQLSHHCCHMLLQLSHYWHIAAPMWQYIKSPHQWRDLSNQTSQSTSYHTLHFCLWAVFWSLVRAPIVTYSNPSHAQNTPSICVASSSFQVMWPHCLRRHLQVFVWSSKQHLQACNLVTTEQSLTRPVLGGISAFTNPE